MVSVHLDYSRQSVRAKQSAELIRLLREHQEHLIILGDLNAVWSGKDPTVRNLVQQLNMKVFEPTSNSLPTFPSAGTRLDWILISDELVFDHCRTLPDALSDHSAVACEVGFSPFRVTHR